MRLSRRLDPGPTHNFAFLGDLHEIIQGLGGRNKVDAPTATWDRAVRFLDRASANGTPVYSMLIARPMSENSTSMVGKYIADSRVA